MQIRYGDGAVVYSPHVQSETTGVSIDLTGDEVASAIMAWLVAHDVYIDGPRTVTVNGELCECGRVYVDPSGFVVAGGERIYGRGKEGGE